MSRRYQGGYISGTYRPFLTPNAPTGVTATAGNTSASIAFTAPTNVGGGAITSYTVISSGGQIGTGTSSPITVSGLTNDTSYTFTVYAQNTYGPGQRSSPSAAVTPMNTTAIEYLVVAGGGGSTTFAGGGGAGGVLAGSIGFVPSATYTVTVGSGGAARGGFGTVGYAGSNSSVIGSNVSLIAIGGGGGASRLSGAGQDGASGGSGGGGSPADNTRKGLGGAGTAGQGYAGGDGAFTGWGGGGGGGAGGVGGNGSGNTAGNGGTGISSSITGSAVFYGGGGGGC